MSTREKFLAELLLYVSELSDRSSPEDQPDMMLVTGKELEDGVAIALERSNMRMVPDEPEGGPDQSAKAVIEGGAILIRVPIEYLPTIVEGAWAAGGVSVRYQVTDPAQFAKELCYALDREEEDGSTPVHRMFDKCIDDAINQGAQGIEEHPDQEA